MLKFTKMLKIQYMLNSRRLDAEVHDHQAL
jgi:hypothetical protein